MKSLACILLLALLLTSNGCMTYSTLKRATGAPNDWTGKGPTEPNPAYYALLPLTVPLDIITSPYQLLGYVYLRYFGEL